MVFRKKLVFGLFEFQVEINDGETYAEVRDKCFDKLYNSSQLVSDGTNHEYDVLVMPISGSRCDDNIDYLQFVEKPSSSGLCNFSGDSSDSGIREFFVKHNDDTVNVRILDDGSLKTLLQKISDAFGGALQVEDIIDVYQIDGSDPHVIYRKENPEFQDLTKKIQESDVKDLPIIIRTMEPSRIPKIDVREFRVVYQQRENIVRAHREDSLKTFFEKFRDAFGETLCVERITDVFQVQNQERKYVYNVNNPSCRQLKRTIEYCSDLNENLPVFVCVGEAPALAPNAAPMGDLQEFEVEFRGEQHSVRVLPEDSLKTFFEKLRDAFEGNLPVENITSVYQDFNGVHQYVFNVEDPTNRDLKKTIEHCSQLLPGLVLSVTVGEGPVATPVGDLQTFQVEFRGERRFVRVLPEDSLKTFFEKFRDAFEGNLPVENITSVYQVFNGVHQYVFNVEDPLNRNLRKPIEHCQSAMLPDLVLYVTVGEGPVVVPGEDLLKFQVEYQRDKRPVRVLPEDSLKTFFEKFRDAYEGNLPVENLTSVFQVLNQEKTFVYNLNDPGNRDLRKPIEHCTGLNPNLPVLLTFRENPECSNPQLHFCLSNGNYKRVPFNPQKQLLDIVSNLIPSRPSPADLRVKSRSLFNKLGRFDLENAAVTVSMCGLSPGDVIEVIDRDSVNHCQSFLCELREKGFSLDEIVAYKKGNDISGWKQEILKDFGRLSDDRNSHILFESITKGGKEYLRALYDCEELPCNSVSLNYEHCFQLWKNCCYVDLTDVSDPTQLDLHDFNWPWGNKAFNFWTWGLVITERDDPESIHYLACTVDGGYVNLESHGYLSKQFKPRTSKIPGTRITETMPRDVALFIAFFETEPSFRKINDKFLVLMRRNEDLDEPRGERSKKNGFFWVKYDQ